MKLPKYRKRADRGYAFVEYNGKRKSLPGAPDSPESLAAYHEFCRQIVVASTFKPAASPRVGWPSVGELVAGYLDWAKGYYYRADWSEYGNVRTACQPLLDLHAATRVDKFGPLALKQVRQTMVDRRWARRHINNQLHKLRRVFRWGVENELVPPAVLDALKAVGPLKAGRSAARETEPIGPVDPAVVDATVACLSPVVAAMVRLQQITGMRSDNLCQIRPAEIHRPAGVWIYSPPRHKSAHKGRPLFVALGPKAQAILRPFLDRPKDCYCFSPRESEAWRNAQRRAARATLPKPSQASREARAKPVKTTGARYNPRSYRRAIWYGVEQANKKAKEAAKDAGKPASAPIAHWHPHQLRHSVGTLVRAQFGLEGAQVFLGHAHAAVTEVYAERDRELARRIAREVG